MKYTNISLFCTHSFRLILFSSILFQLTCCSVQKRRYMSGYHISLTGKGGSVAASVKPADAGSGFSVAKMPVAAVKDSVHVPEAQIPVFKHLQKDSCTRSKKALRSKATLFNPSFQSAETKQSAAGPEDAEAPPKKEFLWEALISFVCLLLAVLCFLAFDIALNIPGFVIIGLGLLSIVGTYVAGMIAIIKKGNGPDRYDGVWLAIIAILTMTILAGFLVLDFF